MPGQHRRAVARPTRSARPTQGRHRAPHSPRAASGVVAGVMLATGLVAGVGTAPSAAAAPVREQAHSAHSAHSAHPAQRAHRAQAARAGHATRSGRPGKLLSPAAARAAFGESVLAEASRHEGAPYVYGASGPSAFDCSGYVGYVFRRLGVSLPRTTYGIYASVRHIPRSAMVPGDLVFLSGLGHMGIYAGDGMMWDAPSSGGRVRLRSIYSSYYLAGRVVR